jgi:hypothetical protein
VISIWTVIALPQARSQILFWWQRSEGTGQTCQFKRHPQQNIFTQLTMLYSLVPLFVLFSIASAFPSNVTLNAPRKIGKRCTGTIQSLADVAAAELCTTINVCSCALAGLYVVSIDIPRLVALLYRQDVRTYIEAEAANLSHLVFLQKPLLWPRPTEQL